MRVLVAVTPRMYSEAIALALRLSRPHVEVKVSPPQVLDKHARSFRPHLLMFSDDHEPALGSLTGTVSCVQLLYSDSMGAIVQLDGQVVRLVEDMSTDDLLAVVDETEKLIPKETTAV